MTPTANQLANIGCHAAFLKALPPPKENQFNMSFFGKLNDSDYDLEEQLGWDSDNPYELSTIEQPECGFSACALGWAIHNPKLPRPIEDETWEDYSIRIFGLEEYDEEERAEQWGWNENFKQFLNPFQFAFYSGWEEDEHAAADRLVAILEHFKS